MNTRQWLKDLLSKVQSQKTPLTLAVVAQASTIAIWMAQTGKSGFPVLNLLIASIAAFSIDLIIVSTAFGHKRSAAAWILALATSVIALIFSSAIAIYLFSTDDGFDRWSILHTAFPALVFFYSWYLSISRDDQERYERQQVLEAERKTELEKLKELEKIPDNLQDYRKLMIRKLIVKGWNTSEIYEQVGGYRQKILEIIRDIRSELGMADGDAVELDTNALEP